MKSTSAEVLDNGCRVGLLIREPDKYIFRYDDAYVGRLLADIVGHEAKVQALIDRSFLPEELKIRYAAVLAGRRLRLRYLGSA